MQASEPPSVIVTSKLIVLEGVFTITLLVANQSHGLTAPQST